MIIQLTKHAAIRALERQIRYPEIEKTIIEPECIKLKGDCLIAMKTRKNGHLLMIHYKIESGTVIVITIIDTSKLKKYLN